MAAPKKTGLTEGNTTKSFSPPPKGMKTSPDSFYNTRKAAAAKDDISGTKTTSKPRTRTSTSSAVKPVKGSVTGGTSKMGRKSSNRGLKRKTSGYTDS